MRHGPSVRKDGGVATRRAVRLRLTSDRAAPRVAPREEGPVELVLTFADETRRRVASKVITQVGIWCFKKLLGTKSIATRSKKQLYIVAPGLTTSNKKLLGTKRAEPSEIDGDGRV